MFQRRVVLVLIISGLSIFFSWPALGGEKEIELEDIVEQWKKTERRFAQAYFEWNDQVFTPKNDEMAEKFEQMVKRAGASKPDDERIRGLNARIKHYSQDSQHENSTILKLNGQNWRLDFFRITNATVKQPVETVVFRDGTQKIFMPGADSFPTGIIDTADSSRIPQVMSVRPLFMMFRPITSKTIAPSNYQVIANREVVNKVSCITIRGREDGMHVSTIYLAPEMEYAIIRWTVAAGDLVSTRMDIVHEKHTEHGWLPSRWTVISTDANGKLAQSITSSLVECKTVSGVHESDFELEFPASAISS